MVIYNIDDIEVIDTTPEAGLRYDNMVYAEERQEREKRREKKSVFNILKRVGLW